MIRLRDKFNFYSQLKYLAWKILSPIHNYDLVASTKNGINLIIRPDIKSRGINSTDIGIACEMFVYDVYKLPSTTGLK